MRPVTIVILAWNRWSLTRRLLDSIARFTELANVRVVVVDNGSTDETATELATYAWVHVIRNAENLGFVRGNNLALRQIEEGHDAVLLNNDVEILHDEWLERLQQTAHSDANIGIVGCRLVLGDGRLLHAGTWIRPDDCWGQQIGAHETDLGQYTETRPVEGIVFACAYLKHEALKKVGLLSEEYRSYFEDTDYCLRAAQEGFLTVCCGGVTMRHDEHGSTSGDEDFRRDLFEESRAIFRAKWQNKLEARYHTELTWQSIMSWTNGYAMSCREMMRALDDQGVHLTYRYAYGKGTTFPLAEERYTGDRLLDIISARDVPSRPRVAVTYAQGNVFERNPARYRIGFTMLEVDGFPRDWVQQANRMDEIWTPTEFGRKAMLDSGVKRPVHVIPLGVDPQHFHPNVKRVEQRGDAFVFIANFEWGERKCPELLLSVFNRTFKRSDNAVLVCKITNRNREVDVANEIRALGLDENGGTVHLIYNRELPHYQLATLYRSADCYISTTRGEGWGLPLLEAMACGLPAIATDWGGHTAILDPADSYPLRVRGTIPAVALCPYYEGFSWADPDPEHLAQLLRHVYENRDEARARGLLAAQRVHTTLTWADTARAIRRRLQSIS
ncbi:MAG TPA: glycosyltransferase [Thermoanaerobaculia bacterium]|jgi:GT2 family glycosyltransferase|nr:glycosyltransferase [Thermoanaerobaculia bacterium]